MLNCELMNARSQSMTFKQWIDKRRKGPFAYLAYRLLSDPNYPWQDTFESQRAYIQCTIPDIELLDMFDQAYYAFKDEGHTVPTWPRQPLS